MATRRADARGAMTVAGYFEALWKRRHEAVVLLQRQVRYRDGTCPARSQCHDNVDRWVWENAQFSVVRGWLLMSYGFERHSVVREQDQTLVEITLPYALPFLLHCGEDSWFAELGSLGCNQIFWPPQHD